MANYTEQRFYFGNRNEENKLPYCARLSEQGICIEDADFDPDDPDGSFILLPFEDCMEFVKFLKSVCHG